MNIRELENINTDLFCMSENELRHIDKPIGNGMFIAETPYVIALAIDTGCEPVMAIVAEDMLNDPTVARLGDTPIYTAPECELIKMTGYNLTQGMICVMKRPEPKSIGQVLEDATRIAVLEHVMNPTNVGAIMRSAAALGFDAVLLSHDCSDPLYRRAARVSMGSVFMIPWAYFEKVEPYKNIEFLKSQGFKTLAMALEKDSISIDDARISEYNKIAVMLGSEKEGLTQKSIEVCDHTVMIPMHHNIDSLNVAAASAVAFWQLSKKD